MRLWQLHNHTPFSVEAQFQKDHTPASFWCVWIKATFEIAETGRLSLAQDQDPLEQAPVPDEGGQGLVADGDFYLPKAATDLLFQASATLPAGADPHAPYVASVAVGDWSKALRVEPARLWRKQRLGLGRLDIEDEQADVPLSYDQAYGGTYTDADGVTHRFEDNPAGCGYVPSDAERPDMLRAPRLFYRDESWSRPRHRARPAGLGPISPAWPSRAALAGTFDTDWRQLRAPILPTDHNPEWRQSAPRDQRYGGHIQGGEAVRFENIRGGRDFVLPRLDFRVESRFRGAWVAHEMRVQTLMVSVGAGRVSMVWCGAMPIGAAALDVALSETHVTLTQSSGFQVSPGQAGQFYAAARESA